MKVVKYFFVYHAVHASECINNKVNVPKFEDVALRFKYSQHTKGIYKGLDSKFDVTLMKWH